LAAARPPSTPAELLVQGLLDILIVSPWSLALLALPALLLGASAFRRLQQRRTA